MIDQDAALAHHLLEIAIAHPIAAIPPDRPEDDLTLEVTPVKSDIGLNSPSRKPIPTDCGNISNRAFRSSTTPASMARLSGP